MARRKSVRSKCLKTCPRAIRLKCRKTYAKGSSTETGKTCNVSVKGLVKRKNLTSAAAGQLVGSIIKQLRAKNCQVPRVFTN